MSLRLPIAGIGRGVRGAGGDGEPFWRVEESIAKGLGTRKPVAGVACCRLCQDGAEPFGYDQAARSIRSVMMRYRIACNGPVPHGVLPAIP